LIFKQNDSIKNFRKYNLLSPEITDTSNIDINFIDQQRFVLPQGNYQLDVQIKDINNPASSFKATDSLSILFPKEKVSISGIQLVDTYTPTANSTILSKGGFEIVPYIVDFFPQSIHKIIFYCEIYNTQKILGANEKYLLKYSIESAQTQIALADYSGYKKEISNEVNALFSEISIDNLPSGNYNLVIEARNKENKLMALNKLFFQRSNPQAEYSVKDISTLDISTTFAKKIVSKDTLIDFIQSLYPIANEMERVFIDNKLKTYELLTLQQFFYNFWVNRNKLEPEKAWTTYLTEVNLVNAKYSNQIKKGYMSDRGRVLLQYGHPNTITSSPLEPSNYPYEIWHYYTLQNQKNRKFVFCTRDEVTNDYELIHSDAIGEIQNTAWQAQIQKRNTIIDIDTQKGSNHWGNNADDFFKNPR